MTRLGIIGFLSMAIEGAMFDWSGVYFQDIVEAPEQLVILGYTSIVFMMAVESFLGNYLIVRFGRIRLVQCFGVLMSSGPILSVLFPNLLVCTLAFILIGLGGSCTLPTVYGIADKHKNSNASISLTLVSKISFLGFLMGPPVIGFVSECFDLGYSYLLFSIFGIIMVVIASRSKILK